MRGELTNNKTGSGWTEEPTPKEIREWASLRSKTLLRDKYRCQRCCVRFAKSELQAHHVIPRNAGGGNCLDNLLTLCGPCHDWVEIQDPPLHTRPAIEGSCQFLKWGAQEPADWYLGYGAVVEQGGDDWPAWDRSRNARYWARIKRIAALTPQDAT